MNYKRNKRGEFNRSDYKITLRNRKRKLVALGIILTAYVLATSIIGSQKIYFDAKNQVLDWFNPKVETQEIEPTDMKEWIVWSLKDTGIDPTEAFMIIQCESRWNTEAINGSDKNGGHGTDLGLWQLNTKFQPQVKPSCSLNYKCATIEAIKIYQKSMSWKAWSCSRILGI